LQKTHNLNSDHYFPFLAMTLIDVVFSSSHSAPTKVDSQNQRVNNTVNSYDNIALMADE
jgi:hypothetical protein